MAKARIYQVSVTKAYMMAEQGYGLSLEPWGGNTLYYEGGDDGGTVHDLPEGYALGRSKLGDLYIYGENDTQPCRLVSRKGKIYLLTPRGESLPLSVSEAQDFENELEEGC